MAWQVIAALVLLNVEHWFADPWSPLHLLSWILLVGSLLLLTWGVFLKNVSVAGFLLSVTASTCLVVTAHVEGREDMARFGEAYSAYRRRTRRFIPFIY